MARREDSESSSKARKGKKAVDKEKIVSISEETAKRRRKEGKKPFPSQCLANLRPYGRGQTGNPGGRPKGSVSLTTVLRKVLKEVVNPSNRKTRAEELVRQCLRFAIAGDPQFAKIIWDRSDGTPASADAHALFQSAFQSFTDAFQDVLVEVVPQEDVREKIMQQTGLRDVTWTASPPLPPEKGKGAFYNAPLTPEQSKERSIEFYRAVVADETQPIQYRLKAQERLDLLMGILPTGGDNPEAVGQYLMQFIQAAKSQGAPPVPAGSKGSQQQGGSHANHG